MHIERNAGGVGPRFIAVCECGYRSTTRATEAMALAVAIWHIKEPERQAAAKARQERQNGASATFRTHLG